MEEFKSMYRSITEIKRLRIQLGNRISANFLAKVEGQDLPEKLDFIDALKKNYKRLADGVIDVEQARDIIVTPDIRIPIDSKTEEFLIEEYINFVKREENALKVAAELLEEIPLYNLYLKHIFGVGPTIATYLLGAIDLSKARYPSSLLHYTGLDMGPDGKGRNKSEAHLVKRTYTKRDGTVTETKGITYNEELRSQILGVFMPLLIKLGKNRPNNFYAHEMVNYRNRLDHRIDTQEYSKLRKQRMMFRYGARIFLYDLYAVGKTILGETVYKTYHESMLGRKHSQLTVADRFFNKTDIFKNVKHNFVYAPIDNPMAEQWRAGYKPMDPDKLHTW